MKVMVMVTVDRNLSESITVTVYLWSLFRWFNNGSPLVHEWLINICSEESVTQCWDLSGAVTGSL